MYILYILKYIRNFLKFQVLCFGKVYNTTQAMLLSPVPELGIMHLLILCGHISALKSCSEEINLNQKGIFVTQTANQCVCYILFISPLCRK